MSEATPAPAPKGKINGKKLVVAGLALLLVAGGGAGGAWWYFKQQAGDEDVAEAKKPPPKPLFTTLEPFTVNLQDPRGERFAQVGVTLQFEDPKVELLVKDRLPAVRNDILLLISSKQIEELLTTEGKRLLADEIRLRAGRALGVDLPDPAAAKAAALAAAAKEAEGDDEAEPPKKKRKAKAPPPPVQNPITAVLFNQFIVQ